MSISIIVPVWNEIESLPGLIRHLRDIAPNAEVIVVDGGSTDGTDLFQHETVSVIRSPLGRAKQMNVGANAAGAEIFWFVHADSRIAPMSLETIERALANPGVAGGCFRLEIVPSRWIYRMRDTIGNLCVERFRIALGDRGFFCRREAFAAVGGFPDIPILEDAEFYRKLKSYGDVVQLPLKIETSARRYEALGPTRTVFFYGFVMLLYALGLSVPTLERLVRRFGVTPASRSSAAIASK